MPDALPPIPTTVVGSYSLPRWLEHVREAGKAGKLSDAERGINRPFPGIPPYRTGITGLYLCGACTHPGGNITGLPGYNAARVIAEDLKLTPWWNPPHLETLWGALR